MMPRQAYVTRDSVCAGDDTDASHARTLLLPADVTVERLVYEVLQAAPLPSIAGGRATWCVASRVPIAVVAQEWLVPKFVRMIPPAWKELDLAGDTVRLHWSYLAQQDPNAAYEVLRRLQLQAS